MRFGKHKQRSGGQLRRFSTKSAKDTKAKVREAVLGKLKSGYRGFDKKGLDRKLKGN